MDCDHSGTQSGAARFSQQTGQLRLVLVCDRCGAERTELGQLDYSPHPCSAPAGARGEDSSPAGAAAA